MATQTAVKPSLTIKRRLKAAPAKVFAAWTEPEKIKRWFGPAGAECTHAEFDLRVGGKFTIVATGSGGETHQVLGVMREVIPDAKLVYTWAWASTPERESLVTVEFKPEGDGTLLTLTHAQFFDEDARDAPCAGLDWGARQAGKICRVKQIAPRMAEIREQWRGGSRCVEPTAPSIGTS